MARAGDASKIRPGSPLQVNPLESDANVEPVDIMRMQRRAMLRKKVKTPTFLSIPVPIIVTINVRLLG